MDFLKKYGFSLLIVLLITTRLFHFPSEIDDPHAWRQSETAQYIHSFVKEGINILQPSVCWMGGHKTLLLEFPLPEALIAVLYNIFGNHLWIARLFFLLFFSISAYYFYKSLKLIFSDFVPEIATLTYCSLPLSLFYSRAIHIDFFAVAFAQGMLYYYLKALEYKKMKLWLIGTLMAIIAFLIKAPYAFYLSIPIIYFASTNRKLFYLFKNSWWTIIPVICVLIWNHFSKSTNSLAPDWDFIPNYNKFTNMGYWYFGTWYQRTLPELWLQITSRILHEVSGIIGLLLSIVGLALYPKNKSYYFSLLWLIGTFVYLAIFYNLNVIHNYYQIPFIAPLSIFIAMGIYSIYSKLKASLLAKIIVIGLISVVVIESYWYAEKNYYQIPYDQIEIGKIIKENTNPEDLVVVSYGGLTPQCPNILYQAKRYGWSIPIHDINPKLYYQLYKKGNATKMVLIQPNELAGEMFHFYDYMNNKKEIRLEEYNLTVFIADLVLEK